MVNVLALAIDKRPLRRLWRTKRRLGHDLKSFDQYRTDGVASDTFGVYFFSAAVSLETLVSAATPIWSLVLTSLVRTARTNEENQRFTSTDPQSGPVALPLRRDPSNG